MNRAISLREHTIKAVKSRMCSHSFSLLNSSVKRVKLMNCKHRSPRGGRLCEDKNIIANTNTSVIYTKSIFNEVNDVECGSILDIPLTIEFVDNKLRPLGKGFVKYNNKTLKLTSTSKDLLLRTHATPVKYIDNNTRKKFLEKNQYNQLFVLQAIHARNSKIFERTYTKLYGKEAYLLYIKQTDSIIKQYVGSY